MMMKCADRSPAAVDDPIFPDVMMAEDPEVRGAEGRLDLLNLPGFWRVQ